MPKPTAKLNHQLADAAFEVWWDIVMPSRWLQDEAFRSKQEHVKALKVALVALGYPMEVTLPGAILPSRTTNESIPS